MPLSLSSENTDKSEGLVAIVTGYRRQSRCIPVLWSSTNRARGGDPSLIRTMGRTSVHKKAYPLTTRPVWSQPFLSEPRSTTGVSPENPRISAPWSSIPINYPYRQCSIGMLCVDSNQFCARATNLSLIGVVSIPHNKLLENEAAYFEHLPSRISTELTHLYTLP